MHASDARTTAAEPSAHVLLTAAEMQAVDAHAVAGGADGFALMRRAGEAVARHVRRLVAPDARVAIVAGPGNNGGDGAVAARALVEAGYANVVLIRAGGEPRAGSDAARAFAEWSGETLRADAGGSKDEATQSKGSSRESSVVENSVVENSVVESSAVDDLTGDDGAIVTNGARTLADDVDTALERADVVVDALLGAGLSREVDGRFAALVRAMDRARAGHGARLVAVDLPSGLDGDTHGVRGVAARATSTVTFVRLKIAHCLHPGRALCGETVVEDIGMPDAAIRAVLDASPERCHANAPAGWRDALPHPEATTHKFRRGHVLVRGGPAHQSGAARLSADAALRAGAGLVTIATSREALPIVAAQVSAVMLRPCDDRDDWAALLADDRVNALVVGPGNGVDEGTAAAVEVALGSGRACVLDADALSCHGALRDDGAARFVAALRACDAPLVLTPHEGEFERVFGHTDIGALPSRLHRARAAAALADAVVVLKGADTVVAASDGRATINLNAPPWLATAGAGDVLAGLVAALLAQGMAAFEAASAAVWLHAEAARTLGWPLTAEQLAPAAAHALGRVANLAPPPVPRMAF